LDWDASVRQYTWHKQDAFKGRNVLYGSCWAGWGFGSNVTALAFRELPAAYFDATCQMLRRDCYRR
ncbi:MAG: hypothetical protein J6333_03395, partial [Planctomycetes bacterium]|nr:hypothetical protein [Planctomycetota bacterium]